MQIFKFSTVFPASEKLSVIPVHCTHPPHGAQLKTKKWMIKISLGQSCGGLDSCSFVTAAGGLWQRLLKDARAGSRLHGQSSRAGLLPSPAHSHPWHSPLASLLPTLTSRELVVADAPQAAWVLVSVSTHMERAVECTVVSSPCGLWFTGCFAVSSYCGLLLDV